MTQFYKGEKEMAKMSGVIPAGASVLSTDIEKQTFNGMCVRFANMVGKEGGNSAQLYTWGSTATPPYTDVKFKKFCDDQHKMLMVVTFNYAYDHEKFETICSRHSVRILDVIKCVDDPNTTHLVLDINKVK